ncbi:hypothetical protein FNH13_15430 [Ornithinimicrobium ciconiae]|uniref:Uncharacterized protein n=1 Tax=Ornithinimicrobium ciconiae TaxID=2594265 RepID=A0A516GDG1_9MICO|nr:hypothetical protein [Ornithinimicrobium ciconiae]QDO89551.1 hypothetical protein FNH13_15430 [Ornithinimicrobium ciconiae]
MTTEAGRNAKLLDLVTRVVQNSFEAAAQERFGDAGVERLVELIDDAKALFRHVPHEWMTDGLTLTLPISFNSGVRIAGGGRTITGFEALAGRPVSGLTIVKTDPHSFEVVNHVGHGLTAGESAITYAYIHEVSEEITIDGETWSVGDTGWPCAMAVPIFTSLEEALDRYVSLNRRPDYCAHIAQAWRDQNRLAFLPKPEKHMRRSLFQALRHSLSGAHVEQEQNQDESKPVDIEVTWWNPGRVAIIEVKWLGKSGPLGERWSTPYKEKRAIDGLNQLADYLDRRDGTNPEIPVTGYLFIFDARRKDLRPLEMHVSRERGIHFEDLDPRYPQEVLDRPDMGRPFRVFLEPIC